MPPKLPHSPGGGHQAAHPLAGEHLPVSGLPAEQRPEVEYTCAHDVLLENNVTICLALPPVRKHQPGQGKKAKG